MSDFRRQARSFLRSPRILVLLAPFVLLAPVWLMGKALYWGTTSTQFIPWWQQAWATLQAGELPLWNPLLGAGAPLLANYQSALLYPPTWIYFLLNAIGGTPLMAWGMSLLVAAHLAGAGLGMVLLTRRLGASALGQTVAGLAFGLSGYLVDRSLFPSINAAVAWLPWVLWAAYALICQPGRGRMLALAAVLALQWLAGHAQVAWYSLLLAAAWSVFWLWKSERGDRRRRLGWLLAAGGLAFALAAAQLLPTLEYLLQSQRASDVGQHLALNYSLWPWRLLGLLAPNLFGNPAWGDFAAPGNFWEDALYVGLLSFLLALAALTALRRRDERRALRTFLLAAAAISLLLALGRHTPLYPWLYAHVPTFRLFQAPARWSLWLVLALAILAALGLDAWRRPQGRALYWSRLGAAAAVAVLLAAGAGYLLREPLDLALPDSFVLASAQMGVVAFLVALLNLAVPVDNSSRWWAWAVALLVAGDLIWAGWGLNPGVETEFYADAASVPAGLGAELNGGRVYLPLAEEQGAKFEQLFSFETFAIPGGPAALAESLLPNMNLLAEVPSANNYDPLLPARYLAYLSALEFAPSDQRTDMLARLGVSLIQHVDQSGQNEFEGIDALPRAQWLSCARWVPDAEQALGLLRHGGINPEITLLLEGEGKAEDCDVTGQSGQVQILFDGANRVLLSVDAPTDGWLLLADTYYPGWRGRVDGEAAEIIAADGMFRAVQVPAGVHQVEFVYRPMSFRVGAALTLLGLVLFFGLWVRAGRNHAVAAESSGG